MKFIVDKFTGSISGGYSTVDNLPVSGALIINVPFNDFKFNISPTIDEPTLNDLLSQKYAKLDEYVSNLFSYTNNVNQEFLNPSGLLNSTYSNFYSIGPNRRSTIRPSGVIVMGDAGSGYSFTSTPTDLYCDYNVYELIADDNINGFGPPVYKIDTNFVAGVDFRLQILDNAGADLQTLSPGLNTPALGMYTGDFFVAIENLSSKTFVLSDFCLYWKE